jgi:hypothetical protein
MSNEVGIIRKSAASLNVSTSDTNDGTNDTNSGIPQQPLQSFRVW